MVMVLSKVLKWDPCPSGLYDKIDCSSCVRAYVHVRPHADVSVCILHACLAMHMYLRLNSVAELADVCLETSVHIIIELYLSRNSEAPQYLFPEPWADPKSRSTCWTPTFQLEAAAWDVLTKPCVAISPFISRVYSYGSHSLGSKRDLKIISNFCYLKS